MRGSTDRVPNGIERLAPTIRGRLVSHAAPDPFLGIEPRLVGWEIAQVQARMGLEELDDLIAAMPDSAIDVPPNRVAAQSPIEMPEHDQKPQPIAPRCFHQPVPTQQGGHPPRAIEPLPMLAGGKDPQPLPAAGPAPAPARVQGEAGLIWEHDGLAGPQPPEFF